MSCCWSRICVSVLSVCVIPVRLCVYCARESNVRDAAAAAAYERVAYGHLVRNGSSCASEVGGPTAGVRKVKVCKVGAREAASVSGQVFARVIGSQIPSVLLIVLRSAALPSLLLPPPPPRDGGGGGGGGLAVKFRFCDPPLGWRRGCCCAAEQMCKQMMARRVVIGAGPFLTSSSRCARS